MKIFMLTDLFNYSLIISILTKDRKIFKLNV
jgi:hypothetical protein